MATDWAADVKKYITNADDEVIAAIVRYCGIALHNQDSSLVSYSDPVELGRVRENFLKKKLGLTQSDADLDTGIAAVGERLKGVNFKNRVTVYYMLLEQFGMLDFFRKGGAAAGAVAGAAGVAAAGAGAAAMGLMGSNDADAKKEDDVVAAPVAATVATATAATAAAPVAAAPNYAASNYDNAPVEEEKSSMGWLWALLGLIALGLIAWWLFGRSSATPADTTAAPATEAVASQTTDAPADGTVAPVADLAMAPAEGTVEIPTGAGVTSEMRDGKPVVKVYFDTAKTDVAPAFAGAAAGLKAYMESHAGSTLAVSGYNDPRGNAAANAELSKNRAEAVKADLVKAGIADASVELVKPEAATDTTVDNAGARRVEVVIR